MSTVRDRTEALIESGWTAQEVEVARHMWQMYRNVVRNVMRKINLTHPEVRHRIPPTWSVLLMRAEPDFNDWDRELNSILSDARKALGRGH